MLKLVRTPVECNRTTVSLRIGATTAGTSATVFDRWQDYLAEDKWFAVRGLLDVPKESPWHPPTNYFAHFETDLDAPDKQIQRGRLIDDWEQYQDGHETDDGGASESVSCRGKDSGDGYKMLTDHESGFCPYHRDQWDGDGDPRLTEGNAD